MTEGEVWSIRVHLIVIRLFLEGFTKEHQQIAGIVVPSPFKGMSHNQARYVCMYVCVYMCVCVHVCVF